MGKKGQTLREYTAEERHQAVARASEVGPAAAARELGLPVGTVSCWAFLARKAKAGAGEKPPAGPGAASVAEAKPASGAAAGQPVLPAAAGAAVVAPQPVVSPAPAAAGRVARVYTPSERARALEIAGRIGIGKAARQLGISRFSLRDWRRKAKLAAEGKRSDSPLVGPDTDPAVERDRRILAEWREHVGLGPTQVRNQLRRAGFKVAVHTVRKVMEEHGYVAPKAGRREAHDRRYEAVRPNQLWHLDFVQRHINKQAIYVLLLLDDFSRFLAGAAIWDGERVAAVIETFEGAVARHGRPEAVLSDGGSAFWSWRGVSQFTRLLEELDVDQIVAKNPETNGKLEALNANVHKELFNPERFFDLAETARRLAVWVDFYNLRRTNTALGGLLVPADRYFGRADRVLAEVEAGRPGDGIGEPLAVVARELDLLRVTSRGGQVELFLMGSRLWPPAPASR